MTWNPKREIDRTTELAVYVPADGSFLKSTILAGAAIVGTWQSAYTGAMSEAIVIHYEGDKYGFVCQEDEMRNNGRTPFTQKLLHAADRHVSHYPTTATMVVIPTDLVQVGTYVCDGERFVVTDQEALDEWTGS